MAHVEHQSLNHTEWFDHGLLPQCVSCCEFCKFIDQLFAKMDDLSTSGVAVVQWQTAAETAVFDAAVTNGLEDLVGNSTLLDALRPSTGASGDAIAAAAAAVAQAETQAGAAQAAPAPPPVSDSSSASHQAAATQSVGTREQPPQTMQTAAADPLSRPADGRQSVTHEYDIDGGAPVNGLSSSHHQQQPSRASSSAQQLLEQQSATSAPIPSPVDQTPSSSEADSTGAHAAAADSPLTSREASEVCFTLVIDNPGRFDVQSLQNEE